MSEMEYNKGILTLISDDVERYVEATVDGLGGYSTKLEYFYEELQYEKCLAIIEGRVYVVKFEVKGGELDQIDNVEKVSEGVYKFETYHYNGGGSWEEVIEDKLSKLVNQREEV